MREKEGVGMETGIGMEMLSLLPSRGGGYQGGVGGPIAQAPGSDFPKGSGQQARLPPHPTATQERIRSWRQG